MRSALSKADETAGWESSLLPSRFNLPFRQNIHFRQNMIREGEMPMR